MHVYQISFVVCTWGMMASAMEEKDELRDAAELRSPLSLS